MQIEYDSYNTKAIQRNNAEKKYIRILRLFELERRQLDHFSALLLFFYIFQIFCNKHRLYYNVKLWTAVLRRIKNLKSKVGEVSILFEDSESSRNCPEFHFPSLSLREGWETRGNGRSLRPNVTPRFLKTTWVADVSVPGVLDKSQSSKDHAPCEMLTR